MEASSLQHYSKSAAGSRSYRLMLNRPWGILAELERQCSGIGSLKGCNRSAQGRAPRRQPQSVALGVQG